MRCWLLAAVFGTVGLLLGKFVSSNVGNNYESVLMVGGAVTFGILGAILGGVGDIVLAIRSNKKP